METINYTTEPSTSKSGCSTIDKPEEYRVEKAINKHRKRRAVYGEQLRTDLTNNGTPILPPTGSPKKKKLSWIHQLPGSIPNLLKEARASQPAARVEFKEKGEFLVVSNKSSTKRIMTCVFCEEYFMSEEDLEEHTDKFHAHAVKQKFDTIPLVPPGSRCFPQQYVCNSDGCRAVLPNVNQYLAHLKNVHDKESKQCPMCLKVYRRNNIYRHLLNHNFCEEEICSYMKRLKQQSVQNQNMTANKKASSVIQLPGESPTLLHEANAGASQPVARLEFKKKGEFLVVSNKSSTKRIMNCFFCEEYFMSEEDLKEHTDKFHPELAIVAVNTQLQTQYVGPEQPATITGPIQQSMQTQYVGPEQPATITGPAPEDVMNNPEAPINPDPHVAYSPPHSVSISSPSAAPMQVPSALIAVSPNTKEPINILPLPALVLPC